MEGRNDKQETKWIKQIADDDVEAFDRLFITYYDELLRFAKQLMPYPSDGAEDVVCAVLAYLWENRHTVKITVSVAAYLYTSVKNRIIKEIGRTRIFSDSPEDKLYDGGTDSSHSEPDMLLQYKELDRRIQYLINKLPDRTRMVFLLSRNEGLTYGEIAELLEISIHSVKTHMYRALAFLKTTVFPIS